MTGQAQLEQIFRLQEQAASPGRVAGYEERLNRIELAVVEGGVDISQAFAALPFDLLFFPPFESDRSCNILRSQVGAKGR